MIRLLIIISLVFCQDYTFTSSNNNYEDKENVTCADEIKVSYFGKIMDIMVKIKDSCLKYNNVEVAAISLGQEKNDERFLKSFTYLRENNMIQPRLVWNESDYKQVTIHDLDKWTPYRIVMANVSKNINGESSKLLGQYWVDPNTYDIYYPRTLENKSELLEDSFNFTCSSDINCRLIFKDDFNQNELNKDNWDITAEKARCGRLFEPETLFLSEDDYHAPFSCDTKNMANLRIISGSIALTPKYQAYFDSTFTTAKIVSKETFKLNEENNLLIKIRASLPIFPGIVPRVYFQSEKWSFDYIINLNNSLWNGFIDPSNITYFESDIDFKEFQDYEIIFHKNLIIWKINDQQISVKTLDNLFTKLSGHFTDPVDIFKLNFSLIVAVNVDKDKFGLTNERSRHLCHSFIIDHVEVYEFYSIIDNKNHLNLTHTSDENINLDYQIEKSANQICKEIKIAEENDYIKFYPANYSKLILQDEFNGTKLNERIWFINGSNEHCASSVGKYEQSCDTLDHKNLEIKNGTLKMLARQELYLGANYTGATITTRFCFKNARVEIRAKRPFGDGPQFSLTLQARKYGCHQGDEKGRFSILEKNFRDYSLSSQLQTSKSKSLVENHYLSKTWKKLNDSNLEQFHVYGVEWNEWSIQWFIDEQVVYQANTVQDQLGRQLSSSDPPFFLPFHYQFNLLIHIGVSTHVHQGKYEYFHKTIPIVEIDYVRIYGDDTFELVAGTSGKGEQANILLPIMMSIGMVIIVISISAIIIMYLLKKYNTRMTQINSEFYYDGIGDSDEKYEQCNTGTEYECVNYNYYKTFENKNNNNEYLEISK